MKDFMCSFNQVLKKLDETCYSLWLFNRATMFIELIVIHDSKQTTIWVTNHNEIIKGEIEFLLF